MGGDDLVEPADLKNFRDGLGKRAERELDVPLAQGLGDEQDRAQAGAAYVGEILAIDDDRALAIVDGGLHGRFEIPCVGAVDTARGPGDQRTVPVLGGNFHLPLFPEWFNSGGVYQLPLAAQ